LPFIAGLGFIDPRRINSGTISAPQQDEKGLTVMQHSRDLVSGPITLDYLVRRAAEGWSIAAIEWVREAEKTDTAEPQQASMVKAEIPYGLEVAESGMELIPNPLEGSILLLILQKIVKEKRIGDIANELNRNGYRTRDGALWTAPAVFNLLPRLIEAGPELLKSPAWQELRGKTSLPN
jgi:hypothetical protein